MLHRVYGDLKGLLFICLFLKTFSNLKGIFLEFSKVSQSWLDCSKWLEEKNGFLLEEYYHCVTQIVTFGIKLGNLYGQKLLHQVCALSCWHTPEIQMDLLLIYSSKKEKLKLCLFFFYIFCVYERKIKSSGIVVLT